MSGRVVRYSEAFKQQVVDEIATGRFKSPHDASQAYGITGNGTVHRWVSEYGKGHLLRKVVRVEKPGEPGEMRRLKKRVRRLEEALADAHMDKALAESFFEILCERTDIDAEAFKKNTVGRRPPVTGENARVQGSKCREAVRKGGNDAAELLQAEAREKKARCRRRAGRRPGQSRTEKAAEAWREEAAS